jgi:hypothetical protein
MGVIIDKSITPKNKHPFTTPEDSTEPILVKNTQLITYLILKERDYKQKSE